MGFAARTLVLVGQQRSCREVRLRRGEREREATRSAKRLLTTKRALMSARRRARSACACASSPPREKSDTYFSVFGKFCGASARGKRVSVSR